MAERPSHDIPGGADASKHSAPKSAYELLVPQHEASAIRLEDFSDLYDIRQDLEAVARKKKNIERIDPEPSHLAKTLEALFAEQIELSEWLGENAQTIITSTYDDFFNGVDMAVEFSTDQGFRHMVFGIDVTSSSQGLEKKLSIAREKIHEGKLTQIKYFKSDTSNIRGELSNIPLFVIGVSAKTVSEVASLRLLIHTLRQKINQPEEMVGGVRFSPEAKESFRERLRETSTKLASHFVRYQILQELSMQLEVFTAYAQEFGKDGIVETFNGIKSILEPLLKDMKASLDPADQHLIEQDTVFQNLKGTLQQVFSK